MKKRSFIKVIFYGLVSLLLPFKLSAIEKKIINPDLTDEQKRIMFGEGLKGLELVHLILKNVKAHITVQIVTLNYSSPFQNLIVEQGGLLLMRLYLELLKLKLITPMV